MKKEELDKFLSKNKKNKVIIFEKYKNEILYMRDKKTSLEVILKYLFTKDEEIKNRYDNEKIKTGISLLSYSIKRFKQNQALANEILNEINKDNKNEDETTIVENANDTTTVDEEKNLVDEDKNLAVNIFGNISNFDN